jgi:hypothetical protein
MNEGWAGWVGTHELPASKHLRTVAEILAAPPTPAKRRAERREQAEAEARRASARDAADSAAAAQFVARANGTPPRDVLAEAGRDPVDKSYGAYRPQYAHPLVGGIGYPADTHQPALRHVTDLGADGLFIEGRSAPPADGFTVVSPPARPSLWARLLGRLRRGQ